VKTTRNKRVEQGETDMRIKIQGRKYHLENSVVIRLQGIALVAIGMLCHIAESDGAALYMWFMAGLMLFLNIGKINLLLLRVAKAVVRKGRQQI
jgi:hypothetical protein